MLIWSFRKWPLMLWQSLVWVLILHWWPILGSNLLFRSTMKRWASILSWQCIFSQLLFKGRLKNHFDLKRCLFQWTSLFFQLLTRSSTSISALEFSNKDLKKYMMTKIFMFCFSSVMICYSAFWEFFGQLILETGERYYVR